MSYFLFGVGLLLLALFLFNWFATAKPGQVLNAGKWVVAGFGLLIAVFLIATGRFGLIWWALIGLLPWISRLRMLRNLWKAARGPSAGQTSSVTTRFFDMTLDHDTGSMDGRIKEGPFVGRMLSDLNEGERLDLAREVARADAQSMRILEAYLDRTQGPDWRQAFGGDDGDRSRAYEGGFGGAGEGGGGAASGAGPMSADEAYRVLGLAPGADAAAVKEAHRRLMKVVHPDVGGSDYMASKVNEAKRVLLGK
ncbi:MAG: DnaJ domain-containing protein [Alphaproteobacteria bacterium]|nr:DnaJ domain-containing protein [Alphaproteobacteria bacterium]